MRPSARPQWTSCVPTRTSSGPAVRSTYSSPGAPAGRRSPRWARSNHLPLATSASVSRRKSQRPRSRSQSRIDRCTPTSPRRSPSALTSAACGRPSYDHPRTSTNPGCFQLFSASWAGQGRAAAARPTIAAPARKTREWPIAQPSRACLAKVPFSKSSKAVFSSSRVFITMGPYQATGSRSGWPETRMKRTASLSVMTRTAVPGP